MIFLLRVVDVSMSTLRILLSVRGRKLLVPILGFVEVVVWIFAAGNAIRHLDSLPHVIGYAGGFTAGTVVGLWIEEKLALGVATMRVVTSRIGQGLVRRGWLHSTPRMQSPAGLQLAHEATRQAHQSIAPPKPKP